MRCNWRLAPVTPGVTGERRQCAPVNGACNTRCYRRLHRSQLSTDCTIAYNRLLYLIVNASQVNILKEKKDGEIQELKEQVRDLMFYMEAQSKVGASPLKEEIQEGNVVVPEEETPKRGGKGCLLYTSDAADE